LSKDGKCCVSDQLTDDMLYALPVQR
jgi:hypothetical protein